MPTLILNLPDDIDLEHRAAAAGWESVEAYVRHLIEQEATPTNGDLPSGENDAVALADWTQKFQALLSLCKSSNPQFDDSRQSIYPVRK